MQREFIKKTAKDLFKANEQNVAEETTLNMLEDIATFFNNDGEDEEHTTSQQCVGIKEIFRGFIVKDWEGSNFNSERFRELNKVLVVNAVLFYKECWTLRNECNNNEEQQRNRVTKWYEEVKHNVEVNEPLAVQTFVRRNKIKVQRSSIESIKQWMCNVKEISKKVQRTPQGDIRRFIANA